MPAMWNRAKFDTGPQHQVSLVSINKHPLVGKCLMHMCTNYVVHATTGAESALWETRAVQGTIHTACHRRFSACSNSDPQPTGNKKSMSQNRLTKTTCMHSCFELICLIPAMTFYGPSSIKHRNTRTSCNRGKYGASNKFHV